MRFSNISAALSTCGELHDNTTLPYFQCLCSGLVDKYVVRAKYFFCKKAGELEKEASAETTRQVGATIGIILAVCALLAILIFVYRRFKPQILAKTRAAFSHCGMKNHYDSCTRMFCVCCQKHSTKRLDERGNELPSNQNLSGQPTSRCGNLCYSDACLSAMEFICDCDCFRTRKAPKYMVPILGKPRSRSGQPSSEPSEEPVVELQPPRRMRSVRKAPPPPMPKMPDAPGFDPDQRAAGTWRPPGPPYQRPTAPPPPGPAHHAYGEPHGPSSSAMFQPPQYDDLFQAGPSDPSLNRGGPLRVSKEFTAQLNQAMAGRRWPSESEI
ncbi:uncharacterized protein LOC119102556 isoform X2 [Pollicipes pollicipes]|uniref:uncharacterized protein LOC119102556 isoform X2 n=1 Tax=Pollicipes pollicipes TaxID=41117 RepID=UPI00188542E0|nr:uncharacterized protein LOC119102556 isoform X2 [Pollicipes pollicipes]